MQALQDAYLLVVVEVVLANCTYRLLIGIGVRVVIVVDWEFYLELAVGQLDDPRRLRQKPPEEIDDFFPPVVPPVLMSQSQHVPQASVDFLTALRLLMPPLLLVLIVVEKLVCQHVVVEVGFGAALKPTIGAFSGSTLQAVLANEGFGERVVAFVAINRDLAAFNGFMAVDETR